MVESEYKVAQLARRDFPWRTVGLFGVLAFLAGAISLYVINGWTAHGPIRAGVGLAAAALLIAQGWLTCRIAVRGWQQQFGNDVAHVARGFQQHEAALRPQRSLVARPPA